jgi:hypothetical protein
MALKSRKSRPNHAISLVPPILISSSNTPEPEPENKQEKVKEGNVMYKGKSR